jgi:hypothetical protein
MDLGGLPRAIEMFIEEVEANLGLSHMPWKRVRDAVQSQLEERYLNQNQASYHQDLLRLVLGGREVFEYTSCGKLTLDSLRAQGVISIEDDQISMPIIYLVRL